MAITFFYIDDDDVQKASEKVQGFESSDLKILTIQHRSTWEKQINYLKEKQDSFDGLILDLRLDDYPNEEDQRADFRGTSLAQEIRTRQKEGDFKTFPIVLFSANEKLEKSLENSGKDLFDVCIDKGHIGGDSYSELGPKLEALAQGYRILQDSQTDLLKSLNVDVKIIDERFISELNNLAKHPIHVIARFLLNELLLKQGLLIDEQLLAARLGVDKNSSEDWDKLLASLLKTEYRGVFSTGWRRWWMPLVNAWWYDEIGASTYLRSTSASKRVQAIIDKFGYKLCVAEKIDKSGSDEFWTICQGYNRPLDPVDGLLKDGQENLYPWQDEKYVSVDAALKRKNIDVWRAVAKLEEEHLRDLEEQYRKRR